MISIILGCLITNFITLFILGIIVYKYKDKISLVINSSKDIYFKLSGAINNISDSIEKILNILDKFPFSETNETFDSIKRPKTRRKKSIEE